MPKRQPSYEQRRGKPKLRVMKDKDKQSNEAMIKTARWTRCREIAMRRNPVCPDPFGNHKMVGTVVPSTEVHHIIPREEDGLLCYVQSNLIALCQSCHRKADNLHNRDPLAQRLIMKGLVNDRLV